MEKCFEEDHCLLIELNLRNFVTLLVSVPSGWHAHFKVPLSNCLMDINMHFGVSSTSSKHHSREHPLQWYPSNDAVVCSPRCFLLSSFISKLYKLLLHRIISSSKLSFKLKQTHVSPSFDWGILAKYFLVRLARLSLNDVVEKKGCVCWRLCTVIYSIIVVESWWFWDHGKLMTQRSGGRPLQWLLRYSVSVLRAWNEQ